MTVKIAGAKKESRKAIQSSTITQEELDKLDALIKNCEHRDQELKELKRELGITASKYLLTITGLEEAERGKLTPDELAAVIKVREKQRVFMIESGRMNAIVYPTQPNGRRSVKWQEVVIQLKGQTFADKILAETAPTFNYRIAVEKSHGL